MTVLAQGRHIGLRTDKPGLLEEMCRVLPPGWKPTEREFVERLYSLRVAGYGMEGKERGPRKTHQLYVNAARVQRSTDIQGLVDTLEDDAQLYVAEMARRRIFVHAGVVGWKGRAIVLPGRSYTGKSTLVAELLRLGATYYSDEYAVLDAKGRVHPFLRPLSIRARKGNGPPHRLLPEDFGATRGDGPLPVGLVALTRFQKGAAWRPRTSSPGKGVLGLLAHAVAARRRPKAALATLSKVVSTAAVLKGSRGEARAMAQALLDRFD